MQTSFADELLPAPPAPPAAGPANPTAVPVRHVWPLWQRVAFRFALPYFVLYAAVPDALWQPVTTWMDRVGLSPYDVIHQRTGSGDTAHDIAKLIALAALAAAAAAIWSAAAPASAYPRLAYPRLGRALHVATRFVVGFALIGYGLHKFDRGQFGELSPSRLTMQVGDLSPMTMVGTFMQASKPYELFGGAAEVLGGLLLFHRRTALLGALLGIGVMTNVAALNWLCGVPVKLYSAHLLVFSIALLAPYAPSLANLLIHNRPTQPVDLSLAQRPWPRRLLAIAGTGLVVYVVGAQLAGFGGPAWRPKSPLAGVYLVERMTVDGVDVPANDPRRWRHVAIDRANDAWIEEMIGRRQYLQFVLQPDSSALVKVASAPKEQDPERWTIETGTKTVKGPVELPLTWQDRGRSVDCERRSLVFRGTFQGKPIEVHTVEKRFRLQTGFRFRQELPDGW